MSNDNQAGFTLVDLLVAIVLSGLLLMGSTMVLRRHWFSRTLNGTQERVVSELRSSQQLAEARGLGEVHGIRFKNNSSTFGLVKVASGTCSQTATRRLESNVEVTGASFSSAAGLTDVCRSQIGGATTDEFVFFWPSGRATSGSVWVKHTILNRSLKVAVGGLTGRISTP